MLLLSTLLSYLTILGAGEGEVESAGLSAATYFLECPEMPDKECKYANMMWYCVYNHRDFSTRFLRINIKSQSTSDKEEWTVTGDVPRAHPDPRFTVKLHIQRRNCSSVEYEYDSNGSSFNTDAIGTEFHELNWWNDTRLILDLRFLWEWSDLIERVAWSYNPRDPRCGHRYIKLEHTTLGGLMCVQHLFTFLHYRGIHQDNIIPPVNP